MNPVELAYQRVRLDLEAMLQQHDADRLRGMLQGEGLPAIGSDIEPAEQIVFALEIPRFDANLARRLAHMTTPLVDEQSQAMQQQLAESAQAVASAGTSAATSEEISYWQDSRFLFNLFLLAAALPREESLFDALNGFFEQGHKATGLADQGGRAALQLRRALCNQQTDDRLHDYWLDRLNDHTATWNSGRRTELMDAWRGLLWHAQPSSDNGFDPLNRGLLALHDTVAEQPQGFTLLRHALHRLEQAFPTSVGSRGLIQLIRPYWESWPQLLKETASSLWPGLEPKPLAAMPALPPELNQVWQALKPEQQRTLLAFVSAADAEGGKRYIEQKLSFDLPELGLPPQETRHRLLDLEQRLWAPEASAKPKALESDPADWEKVETDSSQWGNVDRGAALEALSHALTAIEQRLARGDEAKARRFLADLIEQQRQQPLPDKLVHLAKTLSKAAGIVQGHGYLDWAEQLLREAMAANPNDEVAASGLADVLKARGELVAAEAQYRDNIARWPNNRVTRNGLATVLRKQGRVTDALRLLPEPHAVQLTQQDLYDLHVRAILLIDLGRADEAHNLLERGSAIAQAPLLQKCFERSLIMLELKLNDHRSARRRLAAMPENVISLQLFRLHAAAAAVEETEARLLYTNLQADLPRLDSDSRRVLDRIEEGFCLMGKSGLCMPDQEALDAIFDAEIDMELAA
ncbi:hypothetical protein DJ030_08450 [bacterium endosymbiont of Escarpia laminata]|nr:MAG: hypothetical protein DJ030_08450 [bacterium endosymbiont of Escarpia laminata]